MAVSVFHVIRLRVNVRDKVQKCFTIQAILATPPSVPWRSLSPSPPPRDHLGFHALPAAICLDNTPTARAGEVAAAARSRAL